MSSYSEISYEVEITRVSETRMMQLLKLRDHELGSSLAQDYTGAAALRTAVANALQHLHATLSSRLSQVQTSLGRSTEATPQLRRAIGNLTRIEETVKALVTNPQLGVLRAVTARQLNLSELSRQAISQAKQLQSDGVSSLDQLVSHSDRQLSNLTDAIEVAQAQIQQAERTYAVEEVNGAMEMLGYRVTRESSAELHQLRGSKPGSVINVKVEGDKMGLESTTIDGVTCKKELEALRLELARRGLQFSVTRREHLGQRLQQGSVPQEVKQRAGKQPQIQREKNRKQRLRQQRNRKKART